MANNYKNFSSGLINQPLLKVLSPDYINDAEEETYEVYTEKSITSTLSVASVIEVQEGYQQTAFLQRLNSSYIDVISELDFDVRLFKRTFDVAFSIVIIIIGFPIFALLCLLTKITSSGPAFYKQERMGKNNRKFYIYKFRSMYVDAEKNGPQLSSETDPRITKWGRVLRRTRLDELPQFWNVLKGEMSVVGPRPERQYFIDKILAYNPEYRYLQHLKPGITSMGQVNYGYAESVEQMCERMKYDLQYLNSVSIKTDLSVILKTVQVMIACKGK